MKKYAWLTVFAVCIITFAAFLAGCGGTTTTAAGAGDATTATSAGDGSATTGAPTGEKVTLKYAHHNTALNFPGYQMRFWIDELKARTNGQVEVQEFYGTLLSPKNMYDGVLNGVADIGLSFVTYEPGRFPLLELNDLPGIGYENAAQGSQAFFDAVWANQDAPELKDFQVITAFCTEPTRIMSIAKYETLASLKGAEIRTPGGPKVLEALGAVGVGMPMSEVPQALQTAVIKGLMSSREVLKDMKFAETCKFVLDYPLGNVSALVVMRKDKFEALPDNVKKVIEELAPEAAKFAGEKLDTMVKEDMEWAVGTQGVTSITPTADEAKKFEEAVKGLADKGIAAATAKGVPAADFYKLLQDNAKKYQ